MATELKTKLPDNFVSMTTRDLRQRDEKKDTNTELWLVQVPQGFDVTTLEKSLSADVLTRTGSKDIKIKSDEGQKRYFSVHSYRDSENCKKFSSVVTEKTGQVCLGRDVQNMLVVSERFKPPTLPAETSNTAHVPKKHVPMPTGLKVRFTTFGTDTPCPSTAKIVSKKRKKGSISSDAEQPSPKKKRQKVDSPVKGDNSTADLVAGPNASPGKKKRKAHATSRSSEDFSLMDVSVIPQISPNQYAEGKWNACLPEDGDVIPQISPNQYAKRKWNACLPEDGDASNKIPLSGKKKSRHSDPGEGVHVNGDSVDASFHEEASPGKSKSKRKHKVKTERDSQSSSDKTVVHKVKTERDSQYSLDETVLMADYSPHKVKGRQQMGPGGDASSCLCADPSSVKLEVKSEVKSEDTDNGPEATSPGKKRHKKIKKERSVENSFADEPVFVVDRGGDTDWSHDSPSKPKKHKKGKKSAGSDSSYGDQSFLVDTDGNSTQESLSHSGKKSKKKKSKKEKVRD